MTVNNIQRLKPLMADVKENEFFFGMLIQRRKDPGNEHMRKNVRVVDNFVIRDWNHLREIWVDNLMRIERDNLRLVMRLNKRNHEKMTLDMLEELPKRMKQGNFNQKSLFWSLAGKAKHHKRKDELWMLDIDGDINKGDLNWLLPIVTSFVRLAGKDESKVNVLESPNGWHIVTPPFNKVKFKKELDQGYKRNWTVEVKKNSPIVVHH